MKWYFSLIHNWLRPGATRTAAQAYWLIAGCIPAFLFLTTSGPLPRAMCYRQDLAWNNRSERWYESISYRIVAVQIPEQSDGPKGPVTACKIVFKDRVNGIELATVDNFTGGRITAFWVDQVHKLLAVSCGACDRVNFYSWPACVSLGISLETGKCHYLAISPDGRRVVTMTDRGIKEWDKETGAILSSWEQYPLRIVDEAFSSPRLYYDQANKPKLVRITDSIIEQWDLHSGQKDIRIEPTCWIYDGDRESWLFAIDAEREFLACVLNDDEIGLWSLKEGKLLRSFARPRGLNHLEFSLDGRFLSYSCSRELNATLWDCLARVSPTLEQVYSETRYKTGVIALCDPLVGTNWTFPVGHYCEFSDHCVRVYSYNSGGIGFEYDLPPRWQLFTPWAWAALGAWIGPALLWCRLMSSR